MPGIKRRTPSRRKLLIIRYSVLSLGLVAALGGGVMFLLTGTGVIWSLGENNDTYPSGYSHRLDVTQWHVYRWTVIHTGDDDIEGRLYVDGNPEPLVIRKVNWDMTNRNQIVIVPGGCSPAIEVDYVRWTALDADIPASHYFAPAAK